MNRLRTVHLVIGTLGFLTFVLTGQYMHWAHDHLHGMADGPRLLYRSSHIYLLWSSLLNVLLGCYLNPLRNGFLRAGQSIAGLAIIAGPFLLVTSFFAESNSPNLGQADLASCNPSRACWRWPSRAVLAQIACAWQ